MADGNKPFNQAASVELWRNKHIRNTMCSSILWQGNVFEFNNTHLTCISWKTGNLNWKTRDVRKGCLVLAAGKLVLLGETGKLVVAEATEQDYKPLAQAQILDGRCWTTPVLAGGCIYARNAAGQVVSLDVRTGKEKKPYLLFKCPARPLCASKNLPAGSSPKPAVAEKFGCFLFGQGPVLKPEIECAFHSFAKTGWKMLP